MIDILVIGSGPAGCSAAITARKRGKEVLVISSGQGALAKAASVQNYPGFPELSGAELLQRMQAHAAAMGAQFREGTVHQILAGDDRFGVSLGADFEEAHRIILCTGARQPKLLPGEERLLGRGVSYCGTCDGMLYRKKKVAVIAEGPEAGSEARFLAGICREVHWYGKPDTSLDERILQHPVVVREILGTDHAEALSAEDGTAAYDGIFIFREATAYTVLLPELRTENGCIVVGRNMQTSVPGVFAAGDCTGAPLQAAKAVGEGCIAAISASL